MKKWKRGSVMKHNQVGLWRISQPLALFCIALLLLFSGTIFASAAEEYPEGSVIWCTETDEGGSGYGCGSPFIGTHQPKDGPLYTRAQALWDMIRGDRPLPLYKVAFYEPSYTLAELEAFEGNLAQFYTDIAVKMNGYVHRFTSDATHADGMDPEGRNGGCVSFDLNILEGSMAQIPTEAGTYSYNFVITAPTNDEETPISFPAVIGWTLYVNETPNVNPPEVGPPEVIPPVVNPPQVTPPVITSPPAVAPPVVNPPAITRPPANPGSGAGSTTNNNIENNIVDNSIDNNINTPIGNNDGPINSTNPQTPNSNTGNKNNSSLPSIVTPVPQGAGGSVLTPFSAVTLGASAILIVGFALATIPDISVLRWYKSKKRSFLWKR